jgi:hypothetical protein
MFKDRQTRPVWTDREAKGKVLEDLTEEVLKALGVSFRRNRVNGKGPDFYVAFYGKRIVIENKHWNCNPYGLSTIEHEVISRFKGVRGYGRTVIASHLCFRSGQKDKIENVLSKTAIGIIRLGFEIVDRKTWRRAYRIIRRLIIRLFGLGRFRRRSGSTKVCHIELAGVSSAVVLRKDDVKWPDLQD